MARIDELDPIANITGTDEIIVDDGSETQRGTIAQVTAGLTYASEAQARAGVATGVVMDPLQTANAIDELASVTEAGANAFTGSNTFNGAFALNGAQSETLAATTNNLNLSATSNRLEITLTGDQTLNGLTGGSNGRIVVVRNADASETLTLSHDNAGSTAANRFALPSDQFFAVLPGQAVVLQYSSSRWRLISQTYSVGTDAGDLVSFGDDGSGNPQYPAADGSLITGISTVQSDVRQTVVTGPVDANGRADFIEAGTGLVAQTVNVDSSTPLQMTWGNGFSVGSKVDLAGQATSQITWSGLTDNDTNYLYVDLNEATGALTAGSTILRPVYSAIKPSSPSTGQYWYPNDHRSSGEYWDGAAWQPVLRLFIGEAITSSGSVSSVLGYSYQTNKIDQTYIYPNSGTEDSPATLSASSRYVLDNPYPGLSVTCFLEILVDGEWARLRNSASGANAYGGFADQHDNDDIVVSTSAFFGLGSTMNNTTSTFPAGSGVAWNNAAITGSRVLVKKVV